MGMASVCDGCGAVAQDMEPVGVIGKFDYCAKCAVEAKTFVAKRNALHEEVVAQWEGGLEALKSEVFSRLPNMRLPDA